MSDAEEDDRHDQQRAPITLKVDYKRLNTFFADYTRNISKGGTFIRTSRALDVGTEFVFELTLPSTDGPAKLALQGVVKWVIPEIEATEEHPAGMGIRFVFADPDEKRKVEAYVANRMRESLGASLADKLLR